MRARATVGSVAAALGILTAGWWIGTAAIPAATTSTSTPGTSTGTGTGGSTGGTAPASTNDGTYTGNSVSTRFGDVQVQVTISGGAITDVVATHLTDRDGLSVQISNRAAPLLRQEVIAAQSANVATIGGATYTSDGYLTSLQSALDQAGF